MNKEDFADAYRELEDTCGEDRPVRQYHSYEDAGIFENFWFTLGFTIVCGIIALLLSFHPANAELVSADQITVGGGCYATEEQKKAKEKCITVTDEQAHAILSGPQPIPLTKEEIISQYLACRSDPKCTKMGALQAEQMRRTMYDLCMAGQVKTGCPRYAPK